MNRLKLWLADFPTTPLRIVVTVWLVIATGGFVLGSFARQRAIDESNLDSWLMFLAVMAGIDVAQWAVKRSTAWKPEVTATTTTTTASSPTAATTVTATTETVNTAPNPIAGGA